MEDDRRVVSIRLRESKDASQVYVLRTVGRGDCGRALPAPGSARPRADGDPLAQEPERDARADRRVGRGVAVDGAADVADLCGEGFGRHPVVRLEGPTQCVDTAQDDDRSGVSRASAAHGPRSDAADRGTDGRGAEGVAGPQVLEGGLGDEVPEGGPGPGAAEEDGRRTRRDAGGLFKRRTWNRGWRRRGPVSGRSISWTLRISCWRH